MIIRIYYVNRRFFLSCILFMLAGLLGFQNSIASPLSQEMPGATGKHNEDAVLKYLWPVLKRAGKAGRIYYEVSCQPNENYPDPFPEIDVQLPSEDGSDLAEIREIFRHDSNAEVTEKTSKIIQVKVGKVDDAILRTNISLIKLNRMEQYNPLLAIFAIENSEDVRDASRELGISTPSRVSNQLFALPADRQPHLPASLANITMDQALDLVAQTFGGIVVYGICTKPRLYTIDFTGGAGL